MIPPVLVFLGSYLSITGSIYGLFDKAGKVIDPESKKAVTGWLKNLDLLEKNWPLMFVVLFDRVFTEKHLSWRCFRRSSVASFAAVVMITLVVLTVDASIIEDGLVNEDIVFFIAVVVFVTLILNLLPDYLSLYETRFVLGFMAKSDGGLRTTALLVFDLAATMLISFVVGFVVMMGLFLLIMGDPYTFTEMAEAFWQGLTFSGNNASTGIFIYSTFLTSVWLWLYALSGFLVKAISRSRKGLQFLQRHLNLEEHPLRSMGFVLMLLVTVGYVVWGAALVL